MDSHFLFVTLIEKIGSLRHDRSRQSRVYAMVYKIEHAAGDTSFFDFFAQQTKLSRFNRVRTR